MNRTALLFIFPMLLFLISCKPAIDFSEELRVTDSLKTDLQQTAARFNQLDSNRILEALSKTSAYLNFITVTLHDTIQRSEAMLLSDFKTLSKVFGKYAKTKRNLDKYYRFNQKQIENLAYDLQNRNISSKDSAKKYVLTEKEANAELIVMMKLHLQNIPPKLQRYDSLKPLVEEFIKKINNGTVPPDLLKAGANPNERKTEVEEDD